MHQINVNWARNVRGITSYEQHVLLTLAFHANKHAHVENLSNSAIALETNMHRDNVLRTVHRLERYGLIEKAAQGIGKPCSYRLNVGMYAPAVKTASKGE